MHEALLYEKLDGLTVRCGLCAHGCVIKEGKRGICRVRQNREGSLYSLVYGKPISGASDPIEKKPLFHFLPGSLSFSIATVGCNFRCGFCQNWQISQHQQESKDAIPGGRPGGGIIEPKEIVDQALARGCRSISYTYTEPTVFFEYALDCMKLAHEAGLKNVFVSNGYQSKECIKACRGLLDAANIDLKAMKDDFYKSECKARLQPVLDTLRRMYQAGIWLEVTTLLIPGKNDDPAELAELAGFIANEVSTETPWHVSAYSPQYQYRSKGPPRTGVAALETALDIGRQAGLKHVYAGNVPGHGGEDTICPACSATVISRRGFSLIPGAGSEGVCPSCGQKIAGVFS